MTWRFRRKSDGRSFKVRPFSGSSAERHALKHFLEPRENWDQICRGPKPSALRGQIESLGESPQSLYRKGVWGDAASAVLASAESYIAAVQQEIQNPSFVSTVCVGYYREREENEPYRALFACTRNGIFLAAALRKNLSDLRTAMRPVGRENTRRWNTMRHAQEARRHLEDKMNASAQLQRALDLPSPDEEANP